MNIGNKLLIASIFTLGLVGCASTGDKTETDEATATSGQAAGGDSTSIQASALDDNNNSVTMTTSGETTDATDSNTIYFGYDSSELQPKYQAIVEKHAEYLLDNPNAEVILEGHADERGSREYNMALGEKRAYSISKILELKGVPKKQIRTVSFGEEKPETEGHDETAWSSNRRAVFSYAAN